MQDFRRRCGPRWGCFAAPTTRCRSVSPGEGVVTGFSTARLAKVRAPGSYTALPRPARRVRGTGAPFDRRRYTLFFLAAAELTVLNRTTIGLLAQRVAHTCANEEGIADFDSSVRTELAALVDTLLLLEQYGALSAVDGSTQSYLAGDDALVLYRADPARVGRLLSSPVPRRGWTARVRTCRP